MHEKIYTRFDSCKLSWGEKRRVGGLNLFPFSLVRLCSRKWSSRGQWNGDIKVEVHYNTIQGQCGNTTSRVTKPNVTAAELTLNHLNQEQQKCRWPGSQLYQRRHSRFY